MQYCNYVTSESLREEIQPKVMGERIRRRRKTRNFLEFVHENQKFSEKGQVHGSNPTTIVCRFRGKIQLFQTVIEGVSLPVIRVLNKIV